MIRAASHDGRERRDRAGFSLVETMIALGVLAFGLLGVLAAQLSSIQLADRSRLRTVAMNLAEARMDDLVSMPSADVQALTAAIGYPNEPGTIDPNPADGVAMAFSRSAVIEAGVPEAGVIRMTVNVSWSDEDGVTRQVTLQSLKADG